MDKVASTVKWIDEKFPLRQLALGDRVFSYRATGPDGGAKDAPVIALLHGIGSASASWGHQLTDLSDRFRVIAWDAPGYGNSSSLQANSPSAADYASALGDFFAGLKIVPDILVGHSLGALMAGAYAARGGKIGKALVLADPANGYGAADAAVRAEILSARLGKMEKLGPEGLAAARSSALLSGSASPEALEMVRSNMSQLRIDGHEQAARMLADGNLIADASAYDRPVLVMCGSEDKITPEDGCRKIADAYAESSYRSLAGVGHASHIENPGQFNQAVLSFVEGIDA